MNHDFSFDGGVESGNGGSWRGFFAMKDLYVGLALDCATICGLW